MTPRYAHPPTSMVIRFGQLVFLVTDAGIRLGYDARAAANRRTGDARSAAMTRHGKRKRNRAA